jgi:hypothetical protein
VALTLLSRTIQARCSQGYHSVCVDHAQMRINGIHTAVATRTLRAALVTLAVAAVLCAAPAEPARAQTVATIKPSFSPDRLGARTAITFRVHFAGGEFGIPSPVRKVMVFVPLGLVLGYPETLGCSKAHLQRHGATGCPPRSQIGSGHALMEARLGSQTLMERAKLWAFWDESGPYAFEILGQGYTPLVRRVVFTEVLFISNAPYAGGLEALIPAIPTLPLEPDASVVDFSITMGSAKRPKKPGEMEFFVPRRCPAGGFPWAAEFTYADGSIDKTTAAIPCP